VRRVTCRRTRTGSRCRQENSSGEPEPAKTAAAERRQVARQVNRTQNPAGRRTQADPQQNGKHCPENPGGAGRRRRNPRQVQNFRWRRTARTSSRTAAVAERQAGRRPPTRTRKRAELRQRRRRNYGVHGVQNRGICRRRTQGSSRQWLARTAERQAAG